MAIAKHSEHAIGAFSDVAISDDGKIGRLARAQHGVVAVRQLAAIGIGRRAVQHRVSCGRLVRVHRGVYAVGHDRLTRDGRWMAAVLAGGPDAVLSHRSAAARFALPVRERRIEITVPRRRAVAPSPGSRSTSHHCHRTSTRSSTASR